jgi:hypothetical protein
MVAPRPRAHNIWRAVETGKQHPGKRGTQRPMILGVTMKIRTTLALVLAVLAVSVSLVAFGTRGAMATQGQPILAGLFNNETSSTSVENTSTTGDMTGIAGVTDGTGNGVEGAVNFGGNGNGVYGHADNSSASGVYGQNGGAGFGVAGRAGGGVGTFGDSANGVGVWANSQDATALKVTGKAQFNRSGVATVAGTSAAPKKSVRVSLPITAKSMMTALLQKFVAGVYVVAAAPNVSGGYFTIYLNKAVTTSVGPIAWMVTERP